MRCLRIKKKSNGGLRCYTCVSATEDDMIAVLESLSAFFSSLVLVIECGNRLVGRCVKNSRLNARDTAGNYLNDEIALPINV